VERRINVGDPLLRLLQVAHGWHRAGPSEEIGKQSPPPLDSPIPQHPKIVVAGHPAFLPTSRNSRRHAGRSTKISLVIKGTSGSLRLTDERNAGSGGLSVNSVTSPA
jgi:hypothetical protein